MELVKDSELATVYADPGADLSIYNSVWLQDATVAFKKNWQRDQQRTSTRMRVRTSDMEKIQDHVATLFREVFTKELPMEYAIEFNRLVKLEMEGSLG